MSATKAICATGTARKGDLDLRGRHGHQHEEDLFDARDPPGVERGVRAGQRDVPLQSQDPIFKDQQVTGERPLVKVRVKHHAHQRSALKIARHIDEPAGDLRPRLDHERLRV